MTNAYRNGHVRMAWYLSLALQDHDGESKDGEAGSTFPFTVDRQSVDLRVFSSFQVSGRSAGQSFYSFSRCPFRFVTVRGSPSILPAVAVLSANWCGVISRGTKRRRTHRSLINTVWGGWTSKDKIKCAIFSKSLEGDFHASSGGLRRRWTLLSGHGLVSFFYPSRSSVGYPGHSPWCYLRGPWTSTTVSWG